MNPEMAQKEVKEKTQIDIHQLNDDYHMGKRAKDLANNGYWKRLENLWRGDIKIFYEMKKNTPLGIFSQSKAEPIREKGVVTGYLTGDDILRSMQMQEQVINKLEGILTMIQNDINEGNEAEKKLIEYKNKLTK